jgi:phosphate transport system permease protein
MRGTRSERCFVSAPERVHLPFTTDRDTRAVSATEGRVLVLAPAPRDVVTVRTRGDRTFRRLATAAGASTLLLLVVIGAFLFTQALPAFRDAGWSFFTQTEWMPPPRGSSSTYGVAALVYWTVVIAAIAMVIAVPVSVAAALFITEYAPRWLRRPLTSLIDLLAAVPSLLYGMWGAEYLRSRAVGTSEWLAAHLGFLPIFKPTSPFPIYGPSAFVAGLVVSLMVVPITTSVIREVFSQVPPGEKEGALALGGTRWGMIRAVVLPFGRGGIIGGSMLGLGRALGETIAILLIISQIYYVRANIIEQGANSIAAHIANAFGEANGIALSALLAAGFVLFVMTLLVNLGAASIINRSRSGAGVEI